MTSLDACSSTRSGENGRPPTPALHVNDNDNEGYGDEFPGNERLVALESKGTLSVGEYADTLLVVIEDARAAATP